MDFGPDLTRIGDIRSERDLLEAIVYPSSTIARYYELLMVQKKKGEAAGLLRRDSVDEIVLGLAPGAEQSIPMKEIKGAKYSNVSLMPEVFDKLLKPEQIADLVAYLKEAKGPVASVSSENIPPHHPIDLPGLHAYAQKSIAAGEEIEFRVSSAVPYDLSVVKLGEEPENRDKDPVLQSFKVEKPQSQPIHPGSYLHVAKALPVERRLSQLTLECWIRPFKLGQSQKQSMHPGSYLHVAKALPVERRLSQLTLECWIRPFKLSGWQGLITQHDFPERCGVGLFLNEENIVFGTGAGGGYNVAAFQQTKPGLIKAQRWHHLVGCWDGKKKRVYVDGRLAAEIPFAGMVRPGATALRIGAYGQKGEAVNFYNGDIAMCAVYDRALRNDKVLDIVSTLVGTPGIRYNGDKLNIKGAESGSPVEWHQDWSFYPHTNDDLLAVGICIDDMTEENGCLLIIPGSHKGPILDHHQDGHFIGAVTDPDFDDATAEKVELAAGGISIHHVRALHGSLPNRSPKPRRLLLFQYCAEDAWPLLGHDWDAFCGAFLRGEPCNQPRVTEVPVRLAMPLSRR